MLSRSGRLCPAAESSQWRRIYYIQSVRWDHFFKFTSPTFTMMYLGFLLYSLLATTLAETIASISLKIGAMHGDGFITLEAAKASETWMASSTLSDGQSRPSMVSSEVPSTTPAPSITVSSSSSTALDINYSVAKSQSVLSASTIPTVESIIPQTSQADTAMPSTQSNSNADQMTATSYSAGTRGSSITAYQTSSVPNTGPISTTDKAQPSSIDPTMPTTFLTKTKTILVQTTETVTG